VIFPYDLKIVIKQSLIPNDESDTMYKIQTFGFALSIALAFAFAFLAWHGAATSKAFSLFTSVAFAFRGVARLVIGLISRWPLIGSVPIMTLVFCNATK
jgi:hypothetical protein